MDTDALIREAPRGAARAVDLSYSGGYITNLRRQIDAARDQIIDGSITVPCFPTERVAEGRDFGPPDVHCWR